MYLVLGTALTLSEVVLLSSASFCQIQRSGSLGGETCGEKRRSRTETGNCALNQRPPELPPDGSGQQQPGKGSDGDPVLAAWLHSMWLGSSLSVLGRPTASAGGAAKPGARVVLLLPPRAVQVSHMWLEDSF